MRRDSRIHNRFYDRLEGKVPFVDRKADVNDDFLRYDEDDETLEAFRDDLSFLRGNPKEEEVDAD